MYKLKMRNNRGFTLVEIIVSLAILGIIAVSFISMFSHGFISILSGNRTSSAQNTAQGSIESEIGNTSLPTGFETIAVSFPGSGVTLNVKGAKIELNQDYIDSRRFPRDVELVTFAPGRIFLSNYFVKLNSSNLSETITVLAENPNNVECFAVRLDGKTASNYVSVANNIVSNGTFTVTAGSTKSSDEKTLIIVRTKTEPIMTAICTVIYQ